MKTIKSDSGVYAVEISTTHGKRTISTGVRTKRQAEKIIRQARVKELETAGKVTRLTRNVVSQILAGKKMTNEKAVAEWEEWMKLNFSERTIINYVMFVKAWMRDTKTAGIPPSAVTEKQIDRWINDENSDNKLATRKVQLAALQSYFKFCSAKGYALGNPAALIRINMKILTHRQKEPRQKNVFTPNEFKQMVKAIQAELDKAEKRKDPVNYSRYLFWMIAAPISRYAGLRLGDICTLEWDCFAKPNKMVVWTDKRDARVDLPTPSELAEAIALIPIEDKTYCFPRYANISAKLISKLSVQFSRICQRLQLNGHSFHDLRHTYATECDEKGISTPHIARNLGHKQLETTRNYIH